MSAEALRTGKSKGNPIHTMQGGGKDPSVFLIQCTVYSLILISKHCVEDNSHLEFIFVV